MPRTRSRSLRAHTCSPARHRPDPDPTLAEPLDAIELAILEAVCRPRDRDEAIEPDAVQGIWVAMQRHRHRDDTTVMTDPDADTTKVDWRDERIAEAERAGRTKIVKVSTSAAPA